MSAPYWTDGQVTLYLGDCREVTEWLAADILVTDPPYGVAWRMHEIASAHGQAVHDGIAGDTDTGIRDWALSAWGTQRPTLIFGALRAAFPVGWRWVLIFRKPMIGGGMFRNYLPWQRNWEPVFVLGTWPKQTPALDSVISTAAPSVSGYSGYATRYQHPHAKPVDVMETLIAACPPGVIADPFAGSGSTLIAARNQGRQAVGVEIDEHYCELAARRLAQGDLFGEGAA